MAEKTRTRYIDMNVKEGNFVSRLLGTGKAKHNFSDIVILRNLLSNEKSRILYFLKNNKVTSIYDLAKKLKRDFKSIRQDLKVLEKFGFIEFHLKKTGKREALIPILVVDKLEIIVNI